MKKIPLVLRMAAFSAVIAFSPFTRADTLYWDTNSATGITNDDGTWDAGSTANWSGSTAGSDPLLTWNNGDIAVFTINTNGSNTVTLNGSVTVGGLVVSGAGGGTTTIAADGGDSLALGGNQIWCTSALRTNSNGASIIINASVSGTGNLTFDGRGLSLATAQGSSDMRAAFALSGTNTYSGATNVTKGAVLILDYTSDNSSKLDDNSSLVLDGGSLILRSGSEVNEIVQSTHLAGGANSIYKGSFGAGGTTNSISLGAITRDIGGTLDVTNAVSSLASTTTTTTNGILGGWATSGSGTNTRWASVNGSGYITTGSNLTRTSSQWTSTTVGNVTASESGIGDKEIYALRLGANDVTLGFASDATLKVVGGGIMAANTGNAINGGRITSGMSTGELFVHAVQDFTLGSAIADNTDTSTKTILVKAGVNDLTLTGASTHTGGTIINSGALNLAAGASLASANITLDGGSFVMDAASSIQFNIAGVSAGQFDVFNSNIGTAILAGTLFFNFDSALTGDWQLFELADADSTLPSISGSIVMSGAYSATLTEADGIWTGTDLSGANFTFTEATGILSVSAIPEPSTYAFILGAFSVGLAAVLRRRRA